MVLFVGVKKAPRASKIGDRCCELIFLGFTLYLSTLIPFATQNCFQEELLFPQELFSLFTTYFPPTEKLVKLMKADTIIGIFPVKHQEQGVKNSSQEPTDQNFYV